MVYTGCRETGAPDCVGLAAVLILFPSTVDSLDGWAQYWFVEVAIRPIHFEGASVTNLSQHRILEHRPAQILARGLQPMKTFALLILITLGIAFSAPRCRCSVLHYGDVHGGDRLSIRYSGGAAFVSEQERDGGGEYSRWDYWMEFWIPVYDPGFGQQSNDSGDHDGQLQRNRGHFHICLHGVRRHGHRGQFQQQHSLNVYRYWKRRFGLANHWSDSARRHRDPP